MTRSTGSWHIACIILSTSGNNLFRLISNPIQSGLVKAAKQEQPPYLPFEIYSQRIVLFTQFATVPFSILPKYDSSSLK